MNHQRLHDRTGQIPEETHRALIPGRQPGVRGHEEDRERNGARKEVVDAVSEGDRQQTAEIPIRAFRLCDRLCHQVVFGAAPDGFPVGGR
jgi:hypothetical protein